MTEQERDTEIKRRQLLAKGVSAALIRIPGSRMNKCAVLGVSLPTLDRWITGASEPSEPNLTRLARRSGLTQEAIRNGGKDPQ